MAVKLFLNSAQASPATRKIKVKKNATYGKGQSTAGKQDRQSGAGSSEEGLAADVEKYSVDVDALEQTFSNMDLNGDGRVTRQELALVLATQEKDEAKIHSHIDSFFRLNDHENRGFVTFSEFLKEFVRMQKFKAIKGLQDKFNECDTDGDGQVSKQELFIALKKTLGMWLHHVDVDVWICVYLMYVRMWVLLYRLRTKQRERFRPMTCVHVLYPVLNVDVPYIYVLPPSDSKHTHAHTSIYLYTFYIHASISGSVQVWRELGGSWTPASRKWMQINRISSHSKRSRCGT